MAVILSGIRPSGTLNIGNYLGAVRQWVDLQADEQNTLYFMIADLHALDTVHEADTLRHRVRELVALLIACGIDPDRCTIFAQSDVPAHTQLMWILSSRVRLGDLERMTQFKDKSANDGSARANAALLTYPILMAADILLYQADFVPVGDDQTQHLEFARQIAHSFNAGLNADLNTSNTVNIPAPTARNNKAHSHSLFDAASNALPSPSSTGAPTDRPLFTIPQRLAAPIGGRVRSLSDPTKKMAKSDTDPRGTLSLMHDDATLRKHIMRAVTDSQRGVSYHPDEFDRDLCRSFSLHTSRYCERTRS